MWPNEEQVKSIVRDVLQITGTVMVMLHIGTDSQWASISGAILMLIPTLWGLFDHRKTHAVAVVAAMPGTTVDLRSGTIKLHAPDLIEAAREAETSVSGK